MSVINILSEMYVETFGAGPVSVVRLPGAGGDRIYYRLQGSDSKSAIGVDCDVESDGRAFVGLARAFGEAGIGVPRVYLAASDFSAYLQEDLGDLQLFSLIERRRKEKSEETGMIAQEYVEKSLRELAKMQTLPTDIYRQHLAYPDFSARQAKYDLNYFKYEFVKPLGLPFDEEALEDDFERLAGRLVSTGRDRWGFMYRDFQSRNVMISDSHVRFIDFQGGRMGPSIYDAVSFLWQAKAGFSPEFRTRMLHVYADAYSEARGGKVAAADLLEDLDMFVLFRTLQVLGAYGFRGLVEKRAHFIESIPGALANLSQLLEKGALNDYPELKETCVKILADGRFEPDGHEGLQIKVFSFSYKKGYPADFTGNGGGFMFDCRGMHNPGRYDEYKQLTGLDQSVISFLEEKGEVGPFCDKAVEIVAPSVARYLQRGFSDLQVGFGCTGGRHRSVYCAERTARLLKERFPEAIVRVIHREHSIDKVL